MDLSQIIPSCFDFKALVNTHNFKQEEIDLQSKTVIKVGHPTFDHYLEFIYAVYTKKFDLKSFLQEMEEGFNETQTLAFNALLLQAKYYDDSFEKKHHEVQKQVKKLSSEIQERTENFETKLTNLFFVSLIDKSKYDIPRIKFLKAFLIDTSKQVSFIIPEVKNQFQIIIDLIDGITFRNTNQEIKNQISPNYYFPDKAMLLNQLGEDLAELKYIETTNDFEKTFESQKIQSSEERLLWLADLPKLLYLLYRLNNKDEFVGKDRLNVIAGNLFRFNTVKSSDNIRTRHNKVFTKFKEEEYLSKKMYELKNVLDNLIK